MNKTEIEAAIRAHGITGITSTERLAHVLRLSARTIYAAKNGGGLKQIDRNTFALADVVNWLHGNPRYLVPLMDAEGAKTKEAAN